MSDPLDIDRNKDKVSELLEFMYTFFKINNNYSGDPIQKEKELNNFFYKESEKLTELSRYFNSIKESMFPPDAFEEYLSGGWELSTGLVYSEEDYKVMSNNLNHLSKLQKIPSFNKYKEIKGIEQGPLKEIMEKIKKETVSQPISKEVKINDKIYSDTNEDVLLKLLDIKIKGNYIIRGKDKKKITYTDKTLIYYLYYKSVKNSEECFTLKDLSVTEEINRSERYIKNRITIINKSIKGIISNSVRVRIGNFIINEKKRGYHLNPKILHK